MSDWIKQMKDDVDREKYQELKKKEYEEEQKKHKKQQRLLMAKKYENKIKEIKSFLEKQCEELRQSGDKRARDMEVYSHDPYSIHIRKSSVISGIEISIESNGIFKVHLQNDLPGRYPVASTTLYIPPFLLTKHRVDTWLKWFVQNKRIFPFSPVEQTIWLIILLIFIMLVLSLLPPIFWIFASIGLLIMLFVQLVRNS